MWQTEIRCSYNSVAITKERLLEPVCLVCVLVLALVLVHAYIPSTVRVDDRFSIAAIVSISAAWVGTSPWSCPSAFHDLQPCACTNISEMTEYGMRHLCLSLFLSPFLSLPLLVSVALLIYFETSTRVNTLHHLTRC